VLTYLTEILSKKDWENKEKYGKKIWSRIDVGLYKRSLKFIKSKIFTPTNVTDKRFIFLNTSGGTLTKANIFVYTITPNDRKLIDLINATGKYSIPKNREKSLLSLGKALSGKTLTDISYVVNSTDMSKLTMNLPHDAEELETRLESRKQKLEQLKQDPEKNAKAIAGIEKRIQQERAGDTYVNVRKVFEQYQETLNELRKRKYVIVLTYDTRSVASMSTGNSWRSCMNLDNGEYNEYVPTSIAGGAFVAYLAEPKDKVTLDDPIARILCKAYYSNDTEGKNPDIIWKVSRYYGDKIGGSSKWFPKIVEDFLNANNKPKYNVYKIAPFQYNDGDEVFAHFDIEGVSDTRHDAIKFPKSKKRKMSDDIFENLNELTRNERHRLIQQAVDAISDQIWDEVHDAIDYNDIGSEMKNTLENDGVSDEAIEFLQEILYQGDFNTLPDTDRHIKTLRAFRDIKNFDLRTKTFDDGETPAVKLFHKIEHNLGNLSIPRFEKLVRQFQALDPDEVDDLIYVLDENKRTFERLEERARDAAYENIQDDLLNERQGDASDRLWSAFVDELTERYERNY
jgi:HPt (histidine-containing phosphotransfer) domain-containing protein